MHQPKDTQLSQLSDEELFRRVKADGHEAVRVLFYRHFKMAVAIGVRMSGDEAEGKDIAQQVFIKLWEKRNALETPDSVVAYIKRMAINEALAQRRKSVRRTELSENITANQVTPPEGEDMLREQQMQREIDRAVEALPDKCREVFKLSRFEEMSYKEISTTLSISIKTVENHMGRALRELRTALREHLSIFF